MEAAECPATAIQRLFSAPQEAVSLGGLAAVASPDAKVSSDAVEACAPDIRITCQAAEVPVSVIQVAVVPSSVPSATFSNIDSSPTEPPPACSPKLVQPVGTVDHVPALRTWHKAINLSPASTVAGMLTAIEVTEVAKSVSVTDCRTGKVPLAV